MDAYALLKALHVMLAILAGGTSASSGLWLERAPREPEHEAYALRGVSWIQRRVVVPLFALTGLSGLALVLVGKLPWTMRWLEAGIALWAVALVWVAVDAFLLPRRVTWGRRLAGGAAGLLVLLIVFLMVAKPAL